MRTTLNVDDGLFQALLKATGAKTKTEAVHRALKEFLRRRKLETLKELSGKIHITYDWQTMREFEVRERPRRWRKS